MYETRRKSWDFNNLHLNWFSNRPDFWVAAINGTVGTFSSASHWSFDAIALPKSTGEVLPDTWEIQGLLPKMGRFTPRLNGPLTSFSPGGEIPGVELGPLLLEVCYFTPFCNWFLGPVVTPPACFPVEFVKVSICLFIKLNNFFKTTVTELGVDPMGFASKNHFPTRILSNPETFTHFFLANLGSNIESMFCLRKQKNNGIQKSRLKGLVLIFWTIF